MYLSKYNIKAKHNVPCNWLVEHKYYAQKLLFVQGFYGKIEASTMVKNNSTIC